MPEVVVNGRFLSRRITGVERYGREILSFIGRDCRVESTRANGVVGHMWEQSTLPLKLAAESILWSPANTGPLIVSNQALTIHDLSPLEHPEWFRKSFATWYRLYLPILARRVKVIFTPSHYVKHKVIERFGVDHVVVAPDGVNTEFFHPGARQRLHPLPERYILFVGSLQPRKNLQTLLRAWDEIKNDYENLWLIIAGGQTNIYQTTELNHGERVKLLGYVPEEALPGLYAQATLLVMPSFDEGFGLPVLEAMACATPVIASDGGALPEIIGDAGLLWCASEAHSLSEKIRECLENQDLYCTLVAKGLEHVKEFSWRVSAEIIWKTLHEL
ncbi:MAG: glycosyltransferase family 4 protein [Byssovorax cruenta]